MTSRYHWAVIDNSTTGAIPTGYHNLNIVLPEGAIVKRFMLRNTNFTTRRIEANYGNTPEIVVSQQVHFTDGVNTGRAIYTSTKIVPWTIVLVSPDIAQTWYSFYQAADHELGFNQKASYGRSTDPFATLTYTWAWQGWPLLPVDLDGYTQQEFAVLYYL